MKQHYLRSFRYEKLHDKLMHLLIDLAARNGHRITSWHEDKYLE